MSQGESTSRPVLVAGAGLGGLATAIFLKGANISCRIFEANDQPTTIGGTVTIFPNGMRVLRDCGVKESVVRSGVSTRQAIVQDHQGRPFSSITMGAEERFAEPTITIRRALLHRILIDRAESLGIRIEHGRRIVDVAQDSDSVRVAFADSTTVSGNVLVGADGVHSVVRTHVVPKNPGPAYTGLVFFAGFVDDQDLVSRAGLDRASQYVTVGPIGFLGYSHVDHESTATRSVLWNCYLRQDERISGAELRALPDDAVRRRVAEAHIGWHWPIPDFIDRTATFQKASIFEVIDLERWSRGRVLLVGDAAHAMNPVAGQGANMALEDAQLVVQLLERRDLPPDQVFREFDEVRRPRVTKAAKRAHRSSRLTMVEVGPLVRWFRNRAYGVLNRVMPDSYATRRFQYEVGKDKDEILRRLSR